MRELTNEEMKNISGGNPLAAGILSLASAYATGQWIGEQINDGITGTYSMSTGQAAYYTFNGS